MQRGVYLHGEDVYRVGIIVAGELPRERSTILVRIMAAGPLLADAIADLATLPAGAPERAVAEDILIHLQHRLGKKPSRSPEEEDFMVKMTGNWAQAEERGRDEGRKRLPNMGRATDARHDGKSCRRPV